jgi:thiosulfate/3-mercaptopyruvate sulfurtransferase
VLLPYPSANMTESLFLIEPDELESELEKPAVRIVDLSKIETHAQIRIPDATHVDYALLMAGSPPAPGLLPSDERLLALEGLVGLDQSQVVVAYDDEGSGRAARFAWTLHYLGYENIRVLNGGLHAWHNEGHRVSRDPINPPITIDVAKAELESKNADVLADADYVLRNLDNKKVRLLDARSPEEYSGQKVFSARGGHIPGAVNLNWQETLDTERNLRLKPPAVLMPMLEALAITPDYEIITYCQTHHRSAHAWWMLKTLGFPRVRGYAGSWSEWGNRQDLPIQMEGP